MLFPPHPLYTNTVLSFSSSFYSSKRPNLNFFFFSFSPIRENLFFFLSPILIFLYLCSHAMLYSFSFFLFISDSFFFCIFLNFFKRMNSKIFFFSQLLFIFGNSLKTTIISTFNLLCVSWMTAII